MGDVAGTAEAGLAAQTPERREERTAPRFALPGSGLLDALTLLVGARDPVDVAAACLPLLLSRPGARAVAVVRRSGRSVVVVGSAGYDCGTMAPGADLPLDAGLPVTEAVRTARTVVQGGGPAWVAAPFGGGRRTPGALLVSLDGPPPEPADVERLERLAGALGEALHRADEVQQHAADLAVLTVPSIPPDRAGSGWQVAQRSFPADGEAGGDVLLCLPDGRSGTWLVAADVCGYGLAAAVVAGSVRTALRSCAAWASGPAELLALVESAVAPDVPPGCFVTAAVVHATADGALRVASAGHPEPLLLVDGDARPVGVEPGPPLAMEGRPVRAQLDRPETSVSLPPGGSVLLHTDGLTDRRTPTGVRQLDPVELAAGLPADLEPAVDRLLAAAEATGAAQDDVSVMLARR